MGCIVQAGGEVIYRMALVNVADSLEMDEIVQ